MESQSVQDGKSSEFFLGRDLMVHILQFLDIDAIACAGAASQRWCRTCRSNALWESMYKREFPQRMYDRLMRRLRAQNKTSPKSWLQEYYETPRAKYRGFYMCRQWYALACGMASSRHSARRSSPIFVITVHPPHHFAGT